MKKETIIAVLLSVLGTFLLLVIIGLATETKEDKMVSVPIEDKRSMMEEFKQEFIGGCVAEDATYEMCECSYDKLYNKYGGDGLLKLSATYLETEQIPTEAVNLITSCYE